MKKKLYGVVVALCLSSQPIFAEPVSVLLEKGIYTEETVGDTKKAIEIYQQIVADEQANRNVMAEALFRLGRCYAAEGEKMVALESFETLTKQFPEQTALLEQAAELMPGLKPGLELQLAPWKDGEVLHYRHMDENGKKIGGYVRSKHEVEQDGKACWEIQEQCINPLPNGRSVCTVIADKASFIPYSSLVKTPAADISAVYAPGCVSISNLSNTNAPPVNLAVAGPVYDNFQGVCMVRCFPLRADYEVTYQLIGTFAGSVTECRVQVVGREQVVVPVGTFDCWKINVQFNGANDQQYWYSVGEQTLIKMAFRNTAAELIEQTVVGADSRPIKDHAIRLALPKGWCQYEYSDPRDGDVIALLFPGELKVAARLLGHPPLSSSTNVAESIAVNIKKRAGIFDKYAVRDDSKKSGLVNSCPSEAFVADYVQGGQKMTEYRACYYTDTVTYWLEFFAPKDELESAMPVLDQVIRGVSFVK